MSYGYRFDPTKLTLEQRARIKVLDRKHNAGTITPEEVTELVGLYKTYIGDGPPDRGDWFGLIVLPSGNEYLYTKKDP